MNFFRYPIREFLRFHSCYLKIFRNITDGRYFNPFYNANLKRTGILQIQTNAHLISRIADFYCHLMEREPSVT